MSGFNINDIELKPDKRQKENEKVVKKIQRFLKQTVKEEYIVVFNNWGSGFGKSGKPDLTIIFNGRTWWIEAKDPKGTLSTLQNDKIFRFHNTNVPVSVVDHIDKFIKYVWPAMKDGAPDHWFIKN